MIEQRNAVAAGVAGILLLGSAWAAGVGFDPAAAQDAPPIATPAASFEEARAADLETRVADLSTRVSELGGADDEALAGRLGGRREGFDALYGAPVAYLGPGQVQYDVAGVGRVAVTFTDGVAERVAIVAPRAADLPLAEPDPADWTPERAAEIAAAFAPADAGLDAAALLNPEAEPIASAALGETAAVQDASGCSAAGTRAFTVAASEPNAESVAAVELVLGPPAVAPSVADTGGRANRNVSAVVNTSLGAPANINGLLLQGLQARDRAEGVRPPAEGQDYFAVELAVENTSGRPVTFALSDFVLVDGDGRELAAVCGGVDPAFPFTELDEGAAAEGWVSFQVPADFRPERFVVLAANARVGFEVG